MSLRQASHPVLRCISLATLAFLAGEARGFCNQDPPPANPPTAVQPAPATRWYGYQIMLADAAGILVGLSGGGMAAVPVLMLSPALIHGVHHNPRMAILSPVLRLGLAGGLGALGYYTADCEYRGRDGCGLNEGLGLAVAGLLTAMIIDMATAKELVPAGQAPPASPAARPSRVSLASAGVAPNPQGGLSLVLGGRF